MNRKQNLKTRGPLTKRTILYNTSLHQYKDQKTTHNNIYNGLLKYIFFNSSQNNPYYIVLMTFKSYKP